MNAVPRVSVNIPVYNTQPYLRQCLDSVVNQTLRDIEIICVDDGSTDGSGAICEEYAARDDRIRVIHQKNGGLGRSRNVGMDHSTGKYIIFLDSDDYWLRLEALETLYAEAERNRTQVLAFGSERFWDGVAMPKRAVAHRHAPGVRNGVVKTGPDSLKASLDADEYSVDVWNKLYLRDWLLSTGLRFDEGTIHSDLRFTFFSYLYAERVECIDALLHRYRARPGSIMNTKTFQASARGRVVFLRSLMEVWLSHSRPAGEELLIERMCGWAIEKTGRLYGQAWKRLDPRAAGFIRTYTRPVLMQARALPSLSGLHRLATYSLFLYNLAYGLVAVGKACVSKIPAPHFRHL